MTVHTLRLVWKRNLDDAREDIELGTCFHTSRPAAGELIAFSGEQAREHGGVFRVVQVYHQPFMERSMTWQEWRHRGTQPEELTHYWVEPAEGSWEP